MSFFRRWQHSSPSMTGIMTSHMMMSGTFSLAVLKPFSPLTAVRTWYFPPSRVLMNERISALSSMTNATGRASSTLTPCSSSISTEGRSEQARRLSGAICPDTGAADAVPVAGSTGMVMDMLVPVAPLSSSAVHDSISMRPPISSAYFFTSARPIPVPSSPFLPIW